MIQSGAEKDYRNLGENSWRRDRLASYKPLEEKDLQASETKVHYIGIFLD
jgi:hypothetical protein